MHAACSYGTACGLLRTPAHMLTRARSVFLGVVRPLGSNLLNVRAWVAPNGVFLCGDNNFASMCGATENELVRVLNECLGLTCLPNCPWLS